MENVQRRATKLVPSIKNLSYEELLEALKLPSLVYRRLHGDLMETFRYMHSIYNVENNLLTKDSREITRGHHLRLFKQRFNLDIRKRFYSVRITDHWNNLPEAAVSAASVNAIDNHIDRIYKNNMYSTEYPIPPVRTYRDPRQVENTLTDEMKIWYRLHSLVHQKRTITITNMGGRCDCRSSPNVYKSRHCLSSLWYWIHQK